MIEKQPENAFHYSALGMAWAGLGHRDEAIKWGEKATEMHPIQTDPWSSGESILSDLAIIYIQVGEHEKAIDIIETLLSIPSQLTRWRLKLDPQYDPLRNHPRFQKLIPE
jgi:tetratricopeptide (TPR) repeat protein